MGKLVKRAELSVLGALGIALFSFTHFSAIMSVLDDATSTDATAYTATVVAPYVENTATVPSQPVVTTTAMVPDATATSSNSTVPAAGVSTAPESTGADASPVPASDTQTDTSGNAASAGVSSSDSQ